MIHCYQTILANLSICCQIGAEIKACFYITQKTMLGGNLELVNHKLRYCSSAHVILDKFTVKLINILPLSHTYGSHTCLITTFEESSPKMCVYIGQYISTSKLF